MTYGGCHSLLEVVYEESQWVSNDLEEMSQPGDPHHLHECRVSVAPHRGSGLSVQLALCNELLVLLPAGCLHLRCPVCHRALKMTSLLEREYLHSNLKNMAAFLPGQQKAKYFFRRDLDIQSVFGVLLITDISGGFSREEQTHKRHFGMHQAL